MQNPKPNRASYQHRNAALASQCVTWVAGLVVLLGIALPSHAAMNRGPQKDAAQAERTDLDRGREAAAAEDCTMAIALLGKARDQDPTDPEIHNLLGFCQRKTGRLEEAFASYARALELKPRYPQARAYLGEAHIQAILWQLRVLGDYGEDSKEQLHELVAAYLRTADGLREQFGDVKGKDTGSARPTATDGDSKAADALPPGVW